MPSSTFAERYCARAGITPEAYRTVVLQRTLYPSARLLAPLLRLVDADYFAADFDFIDGVGRIVHRIDFNLEADEFAHNPSNRGPLRQTLRLRVSARRLQTLVYETMGSSSASRAADTDVSRAPFAVRGAAQDAKSASSPNEA